MKKNKLPMRKGMGTVDVILAISLMAIVTMGYIRISDAYKDDVTVKREKLKAYRFEAAIKNSAKAIIDSFEGTCGTISSDATSSFGWGWKNSNCSATSLLPVVSGSTLVYNVNFNSLSSTNAAALQNKIISSFEGECVLSSSTPTSLIMTCGDSFSNLQYDSSNGLVNQFHTPGTEFNFIDQPIPVLTLKRHYSQGNYEETKTYRLSLSDFLEERSAYSVTKMERIGKTLKAFYNAKLSMETINTSPGGLNTIDDEFTPWVWEAFGDSSATASTAVCVKNSSTGVCDNLNNNNIWRSTTGDALLWRRLVVGQLNNDYKYTVDGFGNPLRIYPLKSQCVANDLDSCSVSAPPSPRTPYPFSASVKPPFTTIIYSQVVSGSVDCSDISSQAAETCRYSIVY